MSQLQTLEAAATCSESHLESVFTPLMDLFLSCTKVEMISYCLDIQLGAYVFKSYVSPDKTAVFINDEGISKALEFFENKDYQPVIHS